MPLPPEQPKWKHVLELYESNIGTLTPVVGDGLLDLVEECGQRAVEEAIEETAMRGIRSFRYVQRVAESKASIQQEQPSKKKFL